MVDAQEVLAEAKEQRDREQNLLRPVAEFFHRHEGELFERYEAVDALIEADAVPATDERMLHRVVGNLCADRVDPVQNVVRDDGKYVGVLEYDQHEYWYEYTEVNDVHGRMNVGACAKCVKEADNDAEVARGCGTTEELSERIESHYDEEHSEDPDSVETGATLVSGTSIAGNTVIHSGNDGLGSGLDANTVRGTEVSGLVDTETNYFASEEFGLNLDKFAAPSSRAHGIDFDSNDSVWLADFDVDSIYKLNTNGSVILKFASPSNSSFGIGVDSSNSIWHTDDSSDPSSIYKLNQSGTIQSQFNSPCSASRGVGVNPNNGSLFVTEAIGECVYEIDQSGTEQNSFRSNASGIAGVGVDSSGCVWVGDGNVDSIYEFNQSGTRQNTIKYGDISADFGGKGVGTDSNDSVWIADYVDQSVYKFLPSNTITFNE